jgi:ubiquinone biosynthesis protein
VRRGAARGPSREDRGGLLAPMPRRRRAKPSEEFTGPPRPASQKFDATFLRTLGRFLVWIRALCLFMGGTLMDALLRRDTTERRARRLLRTFRRVGGTMLKIGQQLSMRFDVLPYAYCRELAKLLDEVPSFPVQQALAAVERSTQRPIGETFLRFDPEPIGSASIACVYQAVLKNGDKVAVKVRRPGIGPLFAADLRALGWILWLIEALTILRPGMTRNVLKEFGSSMMEELDFRKEARYQELFRRRAEKQTISPELFFTAPRLYPELCGHDVIVQEFVSGLWLSELLAAVDEQEPSAVALMTELNIDPKVVARRLIRISNWGVLSNVLFHGDPHPANIVIARDNLVIFIDFGACGTMNHRKRRLWREVYYHQAQKDIRGMVMAAMGLLEPLPPVDINVLEQEIEALFWDAQFAIWSKHSAWYERTSASMWFGFFDLCKKYHIPINLDVVRSFRATLLYDTLALRLDRSIDIWKENRAFAKDEARPARKRVRRGLRRRLRRGPLDRDYPRIEAAVETGQLLFERVNRFLDSPERNFIFMVEKSVFTVITVIKTAALVALLTGAESALAYATARLEGQAAMLSRALLDVTSSNTYRITIAIILVLAIRRVMFRLKDVQV